MSSRDWGAESERNGGLRSSSLRRKKRSAEESPGGEKTFWRGDGNREEGKRIEREAVDVKLLISLREEKHILKGKKDRARWGTTRRTK